MSFKSLDSGISVDYFDLIFMKRRFGFLNSFAFFSSPNEYQVSLDLISDIDFPLGFRIFENKLFFDLGLCEVKRVNSEIRNDNKSFLGDIFITLFEFKHSSFGSFFLKFVSADKELIEKYGIKLKTFDNKKIYLDKYIHLNNYYCDLLNNKIEDIVKYTFAVNKINVLVAFKVTNKIQSYQFKSTKDISLKIGSIYNFPIFFGSNFEDFLMKYKNSSIRYFERDFPEYHSNGYYFVKIIETDTKLLWNEHINDYPIGWYYSVTYKGYGIDYIEYSNNFEFLSSVCCQNYLNFNPIVKILGG